jgi:hypothetical protein
MFLHIVLYHANLYSKFVSTKFVIPDKSKSLKNVHPNDPNHKKKDSVRDKNFNFCNPNAPQPHHAIKYGLENGYKDMYLTLGKREQYIHVVPVPKAPVQRVPVTIVPLPKILPRIVPVPKNASNKGPKNAPKNVPKKVDEKFSYSSSSSYTSPSSSSLSCSSQSVPIVVPSGFYDDVEFNVCASSSSVASSSSSDGLFIKKN